MTRITTNALILMLILVVKVQGQSEGKTYGRFLAVLKTGQRIEGTNGRLGETELKGRSQTGSLIEVPIGEIQNLYVSNRSKAAKMALLGAGSGLLGTLVSGFIASTSHDLVLDKAVAISFTIGLTTIGAVMGASSPEWRRIIPANDATKEVPQTPGH